MLRIEKLDGISKNQGKKPEFTIHLNTEYDYRFVSDRRDQIVKILQCRYIQMKNKNLPIFSINEQNLRAFTTTEKDMKRGLNRFPPVDYRQHSMDLIQGAQDSSVTLDDTNEQNYDEQKKLRDQGLMANNDFTDNYEEEQRDDDEIKESIRDDVATVLHKGDTSEDAKLEDFILMRIVGKGTFGKVF